MKLCRDCKHHSVGRCEHPRFGQWTDYVDGRHRHLGRSCHDQRAETPWGLSWIFGRDRCGPQARYFEPKLVQFEMLTGQARIDEPPKPTPTKV
jgi:hypothetical protein